MPKPTEDENYTPDTYVAVSRPASNKAYRIGVLLNGKGNPVRTCGHTRTHTSSKAAVDCLKAGLAGTELELK